MSLRDLMHGHSKALYSTWVFYRPDRLLLDCGEGAATALGNNSFAVERILLTHGHIDHISGLPSLLWARASGMGDNDKALEIYHPQDDIFLADMKSYLDKIRARLPYQLTWHPLAAGDVFPLPGTKRSVQTFATQHVPGRLTLGYKITEERRRLKPEFAALPQDEIRRLATAQPGGAAALSENYTAILAAFGGDGMALDPAVVQGAELLLHEATLLDIGERKIECHATLDEAVRTAAAAQVKQLVLYHISGRYRTAEVLGEARRSMQAYGVTFPVWCLLRDRLIAVET